MLGLWIGFASLFGLFLLMASRRHHRRHHAWGGCGHRSRKGRWGHHGHRRGRRGDREESEESEDRDDGYERDFDGRRVMNVAFGSMAAERLGQKLGLGDDQQGMVEAALADTRRAVDGLWNTIADSRGEIASALRGEKVDDERLAAVFEWHDEALQQARKELTTAWKAALVALTPAQRARVADFVAGNGRGWV